MKALIVYHTKTGHTRDAADDVARGLAARGVECDVKPAAEATGAGMGGYDVVLVGTPTYGQRRYQKPAKSVERFLASLGPRGLEGKTAGAFAVNAGYGADKLIAAMESDLERLGAKVVTGGPAVKAGAPLSLWKGPDASAADAGRCEDFGRRVAAAAGG